MTFRIVRNTLLAAVCLVTTSAFAAGYEKATGWGGQTSGVAGIATPYIQGSQAIYFNPAGLVNDKGGQDVTLNISPSFPSFKGPIADGTTQHTSKSTTLYPFGLTYGYTVNPNLGVGAGIYVSGGTGADFPNATLGSSGLTSEVKADLSILEYAIGAGYKVSDNLKLGLAYRIVQVKGALDQVVPVGGGIYAQTAASGLKDTNYTGFKLGAQYKVNDKTSLGFTYRSETDFKGKGTYKTTVINSGTVNSSGDISLGSLLPQAFTLGATHMLTDNWKLLGEYAWTQYSKVTNFAIEENGVSQAPIQLKWKDQNEIRLAAEYTGYILPIRFGYIWTSQVTNSSYAMVDLIPPGPANELTVGTGYKFGSIQTDGGLEYTWASGSGTNSATGTKTSQTFAANEYVLHLGASYSF